jgi:thiamine biosynthesis lipoprotein
MTAALGDEVTAEFDCFGSTCRVLVRGGAAEAEAAAAERAVAGARDALLSAHARFTRFDPGSELSRLNADPRERVPVSAELAELLAAIWTAGWYSGGLVDGTLAGPLEEAGYVADLGASLPLVEALTLAPPRRPARPDPRRDWARVEASQTARWVRRPPGVRVDGGGLVKGLLADRLAADLAGFAGFGIDCAGDLRVGGAAGLERTVHVESPFDGSHLHALEVRDAGIATSGIGRRSWLDAGGRPAHHLLDPCTGRPAFTGIVQVTALAPTAFEAELRAKTALLGGPATAAARLRDGGVIVFDDGSHRVVEGAAGA